MAKKCPPLHICPARCGSKFEGFISHLWGRRSKLQQKAPLLHPLHSAPSVPLPAASVPFPASRHLFLFRRMLSGIPSSLCIPPRILAGAHTQTTLPFLTGLLHSHPRFYSPGMGSSEPLLISPVLPPSPTLAQIIVCGIISAFSTTGCLYIFFIIIIVCFVNFQRTSFLVD